MKTSAVVQFCTQHRAQQEPVMWFNNKVPYILDVMWLFCNVLIGLSFNIISTFMNKSVGFTNDHNNVSNMSKEMTSNEDVNFYISNMTYLPDQSWYKC